MQNSLKLPTGRLMILFDGRSSVSRVATDFEQQKAALTAAYGPAWNTLRLNSSSEQLRSKDFRGKFGCAPGG